MRGAGWTVLPLIAGAVLCLPGCEPNESPAGGEDGSATQEPAIPAGRGAKVTSISGPGGITSPSLPPGTFVGAGGRLEAGSTAETAKGTLAELRLDGGGDLYVNEDTRISLPGADHPGTVSLERGELVVAADSTDTAVVVQTGDDAITVEAGEVQVRAEGETHRFAVVHGRASLASGGRTVDLSAGDTIETPLPALAQAEPAKPQRSLAPLQDTHWARTFDTAAAMANTVPRGVGSLTARRAGTQTERQALRLTHHHVTVDISGRVAHTEVEQAFFNDQAAVLEGIYRFPIPGDGSISGLSLLVGNTWMEGEIVEKQRARHIFQQIVDATVPRDPALLEWERGNVFKLRIFPIPGRGERRVKLSYTQVLPVVGGKLRYRYPLGGTGATGTPIDDFSFTVRLDGREVPAESQGEITTPMLALERTDRGDVIELHTERESFLPTYDLGLDVPVPAAERPVHTRTFLDRDGQAYFMAAMEPQFEMGIDERPVHYAFVLDRSHSTSPELWTTARGVVDAMTELMDSDDRFTVLACDTACEEHRDGLQAPTSDAVQRAQQFLDAQDLAGASDLAGSLDQARDALARSGDAAQRVVVYLGDGVPTSGEMAPDGIRALAQRSLQDTRVLAVALGSRSDLTALQAVVDVTGGDLVQADARDDLSSLVRELRLRSEVPALRNATLDLPDGMVMARMNNVSAIRPGDTVVVTGKLHHRVSGDIVLRGDGPNGPVSASFPVSLSASASDRRTNPVDAHLPRTWAQMQIQHLTKTEGFSAKDEIIALSKDYTVLSRHTALLVLENDAMFREFNVVRNAKNTSKWDGELPNTADGATATGRAETTTLETREKSKESQDQSGGRYGRLDNKPTVPMGGLYKDAPVPDAASVPGGAEQAPLEPAPEPEPKPAEAGEPEEVLDAEDEDAFDEPSAGLFGGTGRGGGGAGKSSGSRSSSAPARPAPTPSKKSKPKSESKADWGGADGNLGPSTSDPWERRRKRRSQRRWRPPHLAIRTFPRGRARDSGRVQALAASVAADPTDRRNHSRLVRTAIATAHPDVLTFARAWADADPDHAGALEALADALATTGEPVALRAYESVVEVRPFSTREHTSLARAYEDAGDFVRACSHRRALVSIKPTLAHQAGLVGCLQRAGRSADAAETERQFRALAVESGRAKSSKTWSKALTAAAPRTSRRGQLRATLRWSGPQTLDIAIVDRRGRRISGLHDRGKGTARTRPGVQEFDLAKVQGSVFVEVSRRRQPGGESVTTPTSATLELVTPAGRRTIPLTVANGSTRAAKVFWTR